MIAIAKRTTTFRSVGIRGKGKDRPRKLATYLASFQGRPFPDEVTTTEGGVMTRKDYVMIARAINESIGSVNEANYGDESIAVEAIARTAGRIASELKIDNHNFDPCRFAEACGIAE